MKTLIAGLSISLRVKLKHLNWPSVLLWPILIWFFIFLLIPLAFVGVYSFSLKGVYGGVSFQFQSESYQRAFEWIYFRIFWNSFKLSALTVFSCLWIGYPMAFVIATSSRRLRFFLLMLVLVPFWTNFVVRAYATKQLLGEFGPINNLALYLGIIDEPILFLNHSFSIWLGMLTNYLPFMILPIAVSLDRFDFSLLEAARDLGAPPWKTWLKVLIPLSKPGIITGSFFVFAPALGEFVIPDLLGGARTQLIGNLITEQFLKNRDWPFGAALSWILILLVVFLLFLYRKFSDTHEGEYV